MLVEYYYNWCLKNRLFIFVQRCKLVLNQIANFNYLTNENLEQKPIETKDIIALIRKLNPNKANGSDGISDKCFSYAMTHRKNQRRKN